LRRLIARFMRGHVPLLLATIADGLRDGEFDAAIPPPFILVAAMGLGALPQIARHAAAALPLFASLPDADALADQSVALLLRAVGPRPGRRPRLTSRARGATRRPR
jgi:hypothetical protein